MAESEMEEVVKPYSMWVLVGLCLGYKLVANKENPRLYNFVNKQGEIKPGLVAHGSAVNSLYFGQFIELDGCNYKLTSKGFNRAHDRIRQAKTKQVNELAENFIG